jgi:hypothetical protein
MGINVFAFLGGLFGVKQTIFEWKGLQFDFPFIQSKCCKLVTFLFCVLCFVNDLFNNNNNNSALDHAKIERWSMIKSMANIRNAISVRVS